MIYNINRDTAVHMTAVHGIHLFLKLVHNFTPHKKEIAVGESAYRNVCAFSFCGKDIAGSETRGAAPSDVPPNLSVCTVYGLTAD